MATKLQPKRDMVAGCVVDPDPVGSETFSRIRIRKKTIPDPSSFGSEIDLQ
jgi:hypothetical protein